MLKSLSDLKNLEFLNVYGTNITDAGLNSLGGVKSLKAVYLWQTKTTEQGVSAFKVKRPNVIINNGEKPITLDTTFKDTIKPI
jgi:hypothetical protein